ncbi:hypothetical protein [Candidatus Hartigia pinicola]
MHPFSHIVDHQLRLAIHVYIFTRLEEGKLKANDLRKETCVWFY